MFGKQPNVLLTCEHASHAWPSAYRELCTQPLPLRSHRSWDPGAAEVCQVLAAALEAPSILGGHSRLLCDLNRSARHRKVLGDSVQCQDKVCKENIIKELHRPFRQQTLDLINKKSFNIHLSIHSFTPVLDGVERTCEIGFLYDPAREQEASLVFQWAKALGRLAPHWRVRRNYPYRGTSDGHCTALRHSLSVKKYAGIEVECNQIILCRSPLGDAPSPVLARCKQVGLLLAQSFSLAIAK